MCERDGVVLIKSVFSPEDVTRISAALPPLATSFGASLPDPLKCEGLSWLPTHPRVLDLARTLLGEDLVYYLNGAVNYEPEIGELTNSPYTTLHIDAAGREDNLSGYALRQEGALFPAYRFALYLQDYTASSGGLRVAPGSHLWTTDCDTSAPDQFSALKVPPPSSPESAPEDFLASAPSQPGDLVIWNVAVAHGAGAKRLEADPERTLHPRDEAQMWDSDPGQFLPPPGPRNAIFFDYGAPSEATDLYIKFLTQTKLHKRLPLLAKGVVSPETLATISDLGAITLREDGRLISLSVQIEKMKAAGDTQHIGVAFEQLFDIAQKHREHSPYFALFDRPQFEALATKSWKPAAGFVQQQILQRLRQHNDL